MTVDPVRWLSAYAQAWEQADSDAVVELFTDDATYRSHIFREPHVATDGIRSYWEHATATQGNVDVRLGTPVVQGDRVAAEWWTTLTDGGSEVTLPGVLLLVFDGDRCKALREYWHTQIGRLAPPQGWGEVDTSGSSASVGVQRWAEGWVRAWPVGDVDAITDLVSEEVDYRSHPFREPFVGRAGVRLYVQQAFAEETEVAARFGTPIVAGSSAAVEYWVTMLEDRKPVTLAGCNILGFGPGGLVETLRDYWHMQEGTHDPSIEFASGFGARGPEPGTGCPSP